TPVQSWPERRSSARRSSTRPASRRSSRRKPTTEPRLRCGWAVGDPAMEAYHDLEWGTPLHGDRALFELLTLEGAQAGLSWSTILRKRDAYREAFANFDVAKVARFTPARVEKLLGNSGIVRNRLKIESTITNAQAFLRVVKS